MTPLQFQSSLNPFGTSSSSFPFAGIDGVIEAPSAMGVPAVLEASATTAAATTASATGASAAASTGVEVGSATGAAGGAGPDILSGMYAAAQGAFETVQSTLGSAFGHIWSNITYTQLGMGIGMLALAYLTYRSWKRAGVNVTQNQSQEMHTHLNIALPPGGKIVRGTQDGSETISIESSAGSLDSKLLALLAQLAEENRALKAAAAAA